MFSSLKDLFPRAANHFRLSHTLQASQICYAAKVALMAKFGEGVLEFIRPHSFKNGVLKISVPHAGWAQEVHVHKMWLMEEIRMKVEPNVKPETLEDIRVMIG